MADIPAEEKVAIATHFLMSSPPHEAREVLADVKIVLNPSSVLNDGVLRGIFRKYNLQNFETIDADGAPLLLNEYAELDGKHFVDGHKQVYQVDHVTQKATKVDEPAFVPGPNEAKREALQTALEEYAALQYVDQCAVVSVQEREGDLYICLCGSKANLRNYWSGKWKSEWKVSSANGGEISGKVRIVVHYFEDGNVQLDQNKEVPAVKLSAAADGDAAALAKQVKDFISKEEAAIQDTLEEMYQNMGVETFKDMRRVLPISKTKMDWTGAQLKLSQMSKGKN